MHRIDTHCESRRSDEVADTIEVENRLHQRRIITNRVHDPDLHSTHLAKSLAVEIHIGQIGNAIRPQLAAARKYRIGKTVRCRTAVTDVVLDAEIALRSPGVVACRQHDTAKCSRFAYQARNRGCRQ